MNLTYEGVESRFTASGTTRSWPRVRRYRLRRSEVPTMTWFSPFLAQGPSRQRLADYNHSQRARQGKRHRRRIGNLESLEDRTLLSNVTANFSAVSGILTITGDTHSDS